MLRNVENVEVSARYCRYIGEIGGVREGEERE